MREDFVGLGVNGINITGRFAGDIEEFFVRTQAHPFRFAADRDKRDGFAIGGVQDGGHANVFVGNVDARAIGVQDEILRIRSGGKLAEQFLLRHIHQADAIGGFIGLDQIVIVPGIFFEEGIAMRIQLRRRLDRGAAQGHVNGLAVRTHPDAARPFAHRDMRHHPIIRAADDGEVAGFFVGNKNLIIPRRRPTGQKEQ